MLKLEDNPPMRSNGATSFTEFTGDWYAVHTKPRFEKTLAFDLLARGIPYYLPMVLRMRMSGGRKRRVMLPLFTSYLFIAGDEQTRYDAFSTNRVVQVIPVTQREQFIRELSAIEIAITINAQLDLYPFAVIGQKCRVRSGPLMGHEGKIIRRSEKLTSLVLSVTMMNTAVALEVEPDMLEPIE